MITSSQILASSDSPSPWVSVVVAGIALLGVAATATVQGIFAKRTSDTAGKAVEVSKDTAKGLAERAEADARAKRYQDAASQLGHEKAAVRLAGVYAMAGLADDWRAQRQQCVDVLCAYLRMSPASNLSASGGDGTRSKNDDHGFDRRSCLTFARGVVVARFVLQSPRRRCPRRHLYRPRGRCCTRSRSGQPRQPTRRLPVGSTCSVARFADCLTVR